ncbi:MAG TPA: TIM barrel protein, partial [Candidatus Thermoplasmatota archaeon]|nr:TIM barrel protein [Candidatus Thermoplasmatota archaeon]
HEGRVRFLDPASPDPAERARGAAVLGEVARHAMELRAKALLVHPGGVWREGEVGGSADLLRESLADLPRHVPILLENMPETYELRGLGLPPGRSPAAFRMAQGLLRCDDLVDGYVLDVSHAYLAAARGSVASVRAMSEGLGARVRHVHLNGSRAALGSAGEGTPLSDSDYGDDLLREVLSRAAPDAVVVPEIMDGHLDGGKRFDEALAHARRLLASP